MGFGVQAFDTKTGATSTIASGTVGAIATDSLGVYWGDRDASGTGALHMLVK
jgi:hypothetical protein